MRKITLSLATALILLCSYTANAELNMGSKTIFTGTLIEVLEPGPDIQAIITNITNASAAKPYLILLGPGVYDVGTTQIVMKDWVSIQGAGQEVTHIKGNVSTGSWATSGLFLSANNTTLSHLSAENNGAGTLATAVYNNGTSPTLRHVSLTASALSVYNAVHNNAGASPMIVDSSLEVGGSHTAMYSYSNCYPTVIRSYLKGGIGVWTKTNSSTSIEHSYIVGPTLTVRTDGSGATTNIFATTLDGGPTDTINGGTLPKCAAVVDENNVFYAGPACP